MTNEKEFTGNTEIPNWMVSLMVWFLIALSSGAVGTIYLCVQQIFWLQETDRQHAARISAMEVKQTDLVTMMNGMRAENSIGFKELSATVNSLERKVDVMQSRMP